MSGSLQEFWLLPAIPIVAISNHLLRHQEVDTKNDKVKTHPIFYSHSLHILVPVKISRNYNE